MGCIGISLWCIFCFWTFYLEAFKFSMHVSLLFLIFMWIERCAPMYVGNNLFCSAKIIMDRETGRSRGLVSWPTVLRRRPELPLLESMWTCHVLFIKQFVSDGPYALIFLIQFSHGLAAMNHPNVFCLWHNCLEATLIGNCWDGRDY
jgi:hypothetical protein